MVQSTTENEQHLSVTPAWEIAARLEKAEWALNAHGFRRCDIAACNCNSWHHVDGLAARFREIREAVEEAGYSTNGRTLLDAVKQIIGEASGLRSDR